jgi:hypothetical protein
MIHPQIVDRGELVLSTAKGIPLGTPILNSIPQKSPDTARGFSFRGTEGIDDVGTGFPCQMVKEPSDLNSRGVKQE